MITLLGVDPGSWNTGYGVLTVVEDSIRFLDCGTIAVKTKCMTSRLQKIYAKLQRIVDQYQPHEVALEQVFVSHNPNTAIKLGQARGVALLAATSQGATLAEYAPRRIKQAVVGYGAADKTQVQHMMRSLLKIAKPLNADAADALAVAYAHAHYRKANQLIQRQLAKEKS